MNKNHPKSTLLDKDLIEKVQFLLDLGVGDKGRLDHIKDTLEKNFQLYMSDRKYLEGLIWKYYEDGVSIKETKPSETSNLPAEPDNTKKINSVPDIGKQTVSRSNQQNAQPEDKQPVNVALQVIVSILVPLFSIYAFYRIQKLRKALAISAIIFVIAIVVFLVTFPSSSTSFSFEESEQNRFKQIINKIALTGISILGSIFLLYKLWKWSKEWNEKIVINQSQFQKGESVKKLITVIIVCLILSYGFGVIVAISPILVLGMGDLNLMPDIFVVSSGSMMPALILDDIVKINRDFPFSEIKVGDIIMFDRPSGSDRIIVHRVVEIIDDNPKTLRTMGDANPVSIPETDFPITSDEYLGKVVQIQPDNLSAVIGMNGRIP